MTAHGPALVQKAAHALAQIVDTPAADWEWAARAVLDAVADDLRAGALEDFDTAEMVEVLGTRATWFTTATKVGEIVRVWLDEAAAEIRAGKS